jgi:hypothetical protein
MIYWTNQKGSLDKILSDGSHVAVYSKTVLSFAEYQVYRVGAKQTAKNRLAVGGLPNRIGNLSIEDYDLTCKRMWSKESV